MQKDSIEAGQRRTLAEIARQQGELDQAAAGTGKRQRGGRLLTYLSGGGQAQLG